MSKNKSSKRIYIVAIIITTFIFGIVIMSNYPWNIIRLGMIWVYNTSEEPLIPEIKYGEFPFKLEYEIDDKKFLYEDILVIQYDGIEIRESGGKELVWNSYWKNGGLPSELLWIDDTHVINYVGVKSEKYYMDDLSNYVNNDVESNFLLVWTGEWNQIEEIDKYENFRGYIDENILLNEFGIKIISEELPEKINNTFKKTFVNNG